MTSINEMKHTDTCPGCDVSMDMPKVRQGLSRYNHGRICSKCATKEAFYQDWITSKKILQTPI